MTSSAETGPTFPQRRLCRFLRQLREDAGQTVQGVAEQMEWSRNKLYRIEAGASPLKSHELRALCDIYGATPEMRDALLALLTESKARGWFHAYGDVIPDWFELYVGLEHAANRLRHYEPLIVPGLLQVPEYAAHMFRALPDITEAEVERNVALRIGRQKILTARTAQARQVEFIVDEAVLHRPIHDPTGMKSQLTHLASFVNRPNVSVRILPSIVGPHRAYIGGAFVILDFPSEAGRQPEPATIYSEGLTGALYLDKPKEVAAYDSAWSTLEGLALDEEASVDLLKSLIKENVDD